MLCAVTDRRRLDGEGDRIDALLAYIAEASDAGIDLVQIRELDLPAARLFDLVSRGLVRVRGSRTRILVSDRLDVALAAGAHGVHLRSQSVDAARIRPFVPPGFLLGRSVHSVEEAIVAETAGGLDYLILGTMFPTVSKPSSHPLAGLEALRAAARVCRIPVLGIGGINLANVGEVARSGAAGVAAIGLFLGRHAPGRAAARNLLEVAAEIRRTFAEFATPPR
jgi:thiamine-phosphate diphosphorylase